MSWTDERIDRLKSMWEKGLTASQIADELGGVSRNAVIGKAHRLGLKSRPSPVKANEGEAKPAPKPKAKPVEKAAAPRAAAPAPERSPSAAAPAQATP
ncbi:MAG: GcrA family cell cycle regulator, partial [Pseudomonadota bacterium]